VLLNCRRPYRPGCHWCRDRRRGFIHLYAYLLVERFVVVGRSSSSSSSSKGPKEIRCCTFLNKFFLLLLVRLLRLLLLLMPPGVSPFVGRAPSERLVYPFEAVRLASMYLFVLTSPLAVAGLPLLDCPRHWHALVFAVQGLHPIHPMVDRSVLFFL
jgi:hypothetical protein